MPAPDTLAAIIPSDIAAATSEDQSLHAGDATSASLTLLDFSTDWGHQPTDTLETSIADGSTGAGSINLIGTPIQETSADNAGVGLHIAPLTDGGFTAGALFGPAASAPVPFALANLAPLPFAGHGAEPVLGLHDAMAVATNAEPAAVHLITESGVDAASAADIASLAFLENSGAGSPIANSAVGSGGATASQVQAALDESGLSVNGSGIKVGVLSDSFNDLGGAAADEADGALPSTVQVLEDISRGGADEGRAMMQIIHDIAPGAGLAFYTADVSEQDFANGILALAAAGCKVICDDVGYFDEPYFQNGVVAQAIQTVEAEGVTYVTAAGNEASNGYQASFTAGSGTFDGVALTNAENFGGSLTQTITINTEGTGDSVPLTLEWNQAYGAVTSSTADLELLVFHNGSLVATATNTNNQFTNEAGNPWTAYDFASSGTYQIAIENMSGSSTDAGLIFKEITWGDGLPATISGANTGTVVGHSMTPGAITAGAVSAADTPAFGFSPTNESFSSSGAGTELLFANNGTPLSSPDPLSPVAVSSVDDIATTVPGGLRDFYGTSAASASLAGVAALILAADPSLTPAQVETIMEQTADPMGNSAVAGAGLVQVDPAVAAALALVTQTIQVDGTTTLVQAADDYFLDTTGSNTLGPEITQGGVAVTPGVFKAIGAVQVAGGYDVAWQEVGSSIFTIWSVDGQGHFLANIGNGLAGSSTTLENFESIFGQDLNGDGNIGLSATQIQVDGTTKLDQIGNNYYLDSTGGSAGAGPEITQGGVAVTPGVFKAIGAVQVAGGGYDVAWQEVGSSIFTIWSVDGQGHFLANIGNDLAGSSTTLENFESIFGQDLNGDGTVGVSSALRVATSAGDGTTSVMCQPAADNSSDNFHFNNDSFHSSSTGTTSASSGSSPRGSSVIWDHEAFAFAHDHNSAGSTNSAPLTDGVLSNTFASAHIGPPVAHDDSFGNAVTVDVAHFWPHHNGFHLA